MDVWDSSGTRARDANEMDLRSVSDSTPGTCDSTAESRRAMESGIEYERRSVLLPRETSHRSIYAIPIPFIGLSIPFIDAYFAIVILHISDSLYPLYMQARYQYTVVSFVYHI